MSEKPDVRKNYKLNKALLKAAIIILKHPVLKITGGKMEHYTPKHEPFILIANHSDPLDPGFEMIALNRYIRFVAADHLAKIKAAKWALVKLGGVIIKHREKPSSVLTDEILENLRAGISVGIHAEGGTSVNGETGFISEHTGQLVKDSGAALITFRFTGGYLRSPRWANKGRHGPLYGQVVHEYSPEEIAAMSVSEVTETIRRDTFVNVYDEQRKIMGEYKGSNLAEFAERILFMCPSCETIGELHSKGALLKCDKCGYTVKMETDAFWHDNGTGLVYDNICDWDKWQMKKWKEKVLSTPQGEKIFGESGQIIYKVGEDDKKLISENAVFSIYTDSFRITPEDGGEEIVIPLEEVKKAQIALRDSLLIIDNMNYYEIRCHRPRAAAKYVAAWRYLTGKAYL